MAIDQGSSYSNRILGVLSCDAMDRAIERWAKMPADAYPVTVSQTLVVPPFRVQNDLNDTLLGVWVISWLQEVGLV